MTSPYSSKPITEWKEITEKLLTQNPLDKQVIVKIVLESWECIFQSKICNLQIGKDIFPNPQMLGY